MAEEGVLSFVHRAGLRAAAPALAPAAATVLRRRAARASSLGEVADLVYGFDRFGIKLPPWQHRDELGRLLEILRQRNVRTVVEIGTGNGGTLFLLAQAASEDALVVSVDLPAGEFGGGYPIWRAALYHGFATRRQRIVLLRRDSHEPETVHELLKVLHERQIDFLFIDGDHSYQGVARDFEMYAPLVSPTGLIGFHDIIPGLSIPDRFRDRHGDDISCVGDVPRFWQELRARVPTTELVADWDQGRFGIGLVEARDLAGTGGRTAPLRASKPRIA
jgi:predicted O-methyltransferase YrrM